MDKELQECYKHNLKLQARVACLKAVLRMIREKMLVYSGPELKDVIRTLIEDELVK